MSDHPFDRCLGKGIGRLFFAKFHCYLSRNKTFKTSFACCSQHFLFGCTGNAMHADIKLIDYRIERLNDTLRYENDVYKEPRMLEKENLIKLARMQMPFGKYAGRVLIDLPEEYLLWFANKKQFPSGELGNLMQLCLALKVEGLDSVVKPLKRDYHNRY